MPDKITAIYARQSIDKKDSISVESQIEFCRRECAGLYEIYEDRGFSGKNINRPAFERLMRDVEAGRVSKLVCYRLDRISRSILDFGSIWETLSCAGVEFVSVNEKFDTSTPGGRAMLYIIMVFAQ
ncbi:MAG TPA: recombinase family protein, partial [Clostridia bacterium]|nr:recombinase family protein [Clostridia bacterium]